jgi:hypothetical protein
VFFHAVSCELYPEICRSYGIDGFPVVLGYTVGESIEERGWTLNEEGVTMTAETIAEILELALAHEPKAVTSRNFTDSEDERAYQCDYKLWPKPQRRRRKCGTSTSQL